MRVVNLRDEKYDVYIGRGGKGKSGEFGNPFIVGVHGVRGECVVHFHTLVCGNEDGVKHMAEILKEAVSETKRRRYLLLKGMRKLKEDSVLGCFCKPLACHGDVIKLWCTQYRFDPEVKLATDSEIEEFEKANTLF